MAKKKEGAEARAGGRHTGWKKLLYGSAIFISFGGSLLLLIFTFLINDAMDKTRDLALANVENIGNDLTALEGALESAENELGMLNATITGLQETFTPLENGLRKTGTSIEDMADAISQVPFIGQTVPLADLRNASDSMEEAASGLNETAATLDGHKAGMSELKGRVGGIRQEVANQRATLAQTASSIADVFGLIKIANALFFLVVICMFGMLVIDSAAGML